MRLAVKRALPALLAAALAHAQGASLANPYESPTPSPSPPAPAPPAPPPSPSPTPAPPPSPTPTSTAPDFLALRGASLEVTDLAAALEPYLQTCKYDEAYLTRQCEALKERLMYLGASRLLRVSIPTTGGVGAATVDKRDVVVRACLTCGGPAVLAGELSGGGLVLGKLPQRIRAGAAGFALDGIELGRVPLAAEKEPARVAPSLVTEVVFRARNEAPAAVSKQPVVLVDILGWRAYDRCEGKIYASAPAGDAGIVAAMEKDDPTCPGYVPPVVKVVENLPETLTAEDITRVMEGAREDVLVCYDKYGVAGYAPATIVVGGADGRMRSIAIGGKFEKTETAGCIEKLMRAVTFPRFRATDLTIDWKFYLNE